MFCFLHMIDILVFFLLQNTDKQKILNFYVIILIVIYFIKY